MKTALIIGADEFLGLSLCERLMDEGVHVDVILAEPEDKTRQLYLEERLMWLARNGLFQIIDEIGEKEYDRICVQYGSGCLPEERAEPLYWIVYSEDHGDWEKKRSAGYGKSDYPSSPLRSVDRSKRRWRKQDLFRRRSLRADESA